MWRNVIGHEFTNAENAILDRICTGLFFGVFFLDVGPLWGQFSTAIFSFLLTLILLEI